MTALTLIAVARDSGSRAQHISVERKHRMYDMYTVTSTVVTNSSHLSLPLGVGETGIPDADRRTFPP